MLMHRICRRQIYTVLTETELAHQFQFATVGALLQHPVLKTFVLWVKTKPEDFFVTTSKSTRIRKK